MKKIVIHRAGGYDRLHLEQHPDPLPGDGEVLIAVEAIGVNFADCITRMGLYASARQYVGYPITPGFEVSGRVSAIGPGVEDLKMGDAVIGLTRFNGYATRLVLPRRQVFPLPQRLSMTEGAGFCTVFLTAWFALCELAHPHPGDHVLVHSAGGGVGGALVQLGKMAGCRVVGVVGAPHKRDAVQALGADAVIDKSIQDLWAAARHHSPRGYEVVLDANGAATLDQSYRHLAPVGKLVVYGFHGMFPRQGGRPNWPKLVWDYLRTPRFSPFKLTAENRSVLGFNLSFLFDKAELLIHGTEQLLRWVGEDKLHPLTITAYPFERVADAHRDLESGRTVGKLVLITHDAD